LLKSRVYAASVLMLLLALIILNFSGICARGQVKYGTIYTPAFPNDFPTARTHSPIPSFSSSSSSGGMSYLPDGQVAPVNVKFESWINMVNESNGNMTIIASSYAFVSDVSQNMNVHASFGRYTSATFLLTPKIRSGIDGEFTVYYQAVNALSEVVDNRTGTIVVWSSAHEEAADLLYVASTLVGAYPYMFGFYGSTSAQAELHLTQATMEYALATIAFNGNDWNGSNTHAKRTIDLVEAAGSSEAEHSLWDRAAFLVRTETYPLLIVAMLIMIYAVAATYRKIRPATQSETSLQSQRND
jgi:hypothetical protein